MHFCNSAFVEGQEENKKRECHGELYISVDPTQLYKAWRIVADQLENTSLSIYGAIHATFSVDNDQSQHGKEMVLQVLTDQENQEEWLQFLSLVAHYFSQEGIHPDGGAILSDFEKTQGTIAASIPCQDVPSYFTFRSLTPLRVHNPFEGLKIVSFN